MVALTSDRNTAEINGDDRAGSLGANQSIWAGSIIMRNAAGDLIKGATAVGCFGAGRAEERIASTTAGVTAIQYKVSTFRFANSAAGDLITKADIGTLCFIVDDQTVARTNGTNTRSPAGTVEGVDAQGVWVCFNEAIARAYLS
jgi:hypothetical protein